MSHDGRFKAGNLIVVIIEIKMIRMRGEKSVSWIKKVRDARL